MLMGNPAESAKRMLHCDCHVLCRVYPCFSEYIVLEIKPVFSKGVTTEEMFKQLMAINGNSDAYRIYSKRGQNAVRPSALSYLPINPRHLADKETLSQALRDYLSGSIQKMI